ncbi:sigma-70 family RNA polymerase sigma factor [bacterium]|nr:sigma-70 family RNA polymerase sigma factor [bacterium]
MELAQDKINLIEKLIKSNRKFANNEDLYEDFFNEACKRSMPIISAISSDATLEVYLRKVATSSILNVLKDSGRLRRTHDSYVATENVPIHESNSYSNVYADVKIEYEPIDFDNGPEDIAIKNEALKLVISSLHRINEEEPEKQYLDLYKLRYQEGMTQAEIAQELNLSQSEVSKRLFRLMQKIKISFND